MRETSMVKGNSHVLWRSTHSKPHCTESDVRHKVPRSCFHPLQKGLSAAFQRSECAGFRSSAKTQFIRDYISMMPLRAKDWTIEKADKLATDELIRAIRYLQEKIEPEPDELQES